MKKTQKKYFEKVYPHYLDWRKRVWVIQSGDILEKRGIKYRVKQVLKSSSYSICPKIILEKLTDV